MIKIALKIKMGKTGFSIYNIRIFFTHTKVRILKVGERFT